MAAVGMYDTEHNCPTYASVVLFGYKPRRFMPGLYVQYVCFKGEDVTSEVENEMQLEGNYCELLPRLESLLELSVIKKKPVFVSILREEMVSNYPYQAIRELLLNACMHRDMQSNTPLRFYEFAGHLEILNAGGLYGNARPENFPRINDYRNPLVASAMKTLGYVNMFNRGVGQVQTDLKENGNQPAEFNVNLITAFKVDVRVSQSYTKENGGKTGGKTGGKVGGDVPSLSQALSLVLSPVCPQLSEVQLKKIVSVIDYLFRASGSITELMDCAGEKNKSRFRQTILKHLVDTGLVEPTIKDVPNSPKQKYALTDNGRENLQTIS
jgi:ATP-dependent DNA helicase RecG